MKLPKKIREFLAGIQDYIEAEKEIIRLKLVKKSSTVIGVLFSVMFIFILFHIAIAITGIWLGFYLSSVLDSLTLGFGITSLIYFSWLALVVVFRKALLVKPISKLLIAIFTEKEEKIAEERNEQ